jgi:gas vesicle protein GvpL/GvpF
VGRTPIGTYVYCVVAAVHRPTPRRLPAALSGMGAVRFLDLDRGVWLVAADIPLDRYSEDAINRKLSDLDWVSRAAVAHEAVIESFVHASAVLPMKLFTIFSSDERALEDMRRDWPRIAALVTRVTNHDEWGVRVVRQAPRRPKATRVAATNTGRGRSGVDYLSRKKAQREEVAELTAHARETVASLYDRLAAKSRLARRRTASELPIQGGPLLLDAAFLVPRSRVNAFRSLAAREARSLHRDGYGVALSGPWPPYSFIQE